MSEEDAFLMSIAADRADRTRLLAFADWLADRIDPREEFVRLHLKLLEMDGTEPGFLGLETEWWGWTFGEFRLDPSRVGARLPDRWTDGICRVFRYPEIEAYYAEGSDHPSIKVEHQSFTPGDHLESHPTDALILYHERPEHFDDPFQFVAATVLPNLRWSNPFRTISPTDVSTQYRYLLPCTCGTFWQTWRTHCSALRNPPPVPAIDRDNYFLGAQHIEGDTDNHGYVAAYQRDYFALFWSTTA